MKIVEYEFEVDAPWELALLAYDRKSWAVPSPEYKEILRCDFDEWEVDLDLELTKFRRSVQVSMPLPQWIMRFLSDDTDFWYEFRTIMDRKNRRLDVKGHNASLQSLLSTTEHMVMKEHPENPNKCVLTYHTTWDIHSKSWVVPKFETFISRLYYKALKRGRQLDKRYIDQYRKTYEEQEIPLTRSERNGALVHAHAPHSSIPNPLRLNDVAF
ncbi:uncharacterized protein MONBRDRAFT_26278 [Monosiga brevicollis MX1]|uniref:PRELI/MSF1 domain-containing protein n=1 Tax=Monosiga brevicollis TaxID=81824 RepID=A9V1W7_MONBE|nr:uncharacterized protein MONBRDRAFT_26278 [Monosiga brevicollis MX1]EDQ88635.1 predicted protein [Monosiga brevicollis MX1]|eukprot:XP_001746739.1 hypothetical protein [Monosiga brevicollis MX1]